MIHLSKNGTASLLQSAKFYNRKFGNPIRESFRNFSVFKPSPSTIAVKEHPVDVTNRQMIQADSGLQRFIQRTYLFTGASVVGSIGISTLLAQSDIAITNPSYALGAAVIGLVGGIGGIFGISKSPFTIQKEVFLTSTKESLTIYSSRNSPQRLAFFGVFLSSMSIGTYPLFAIFPDAIIPAVIASSTVFGSASLYAYSVPAGSLSPWKSALGTSLLSLIGISLVSFGTSLILGPNSSLTLMLNSLDLYLGIPLFTAFIAYDTDKAIQMYQRGSPDHLFCSVELYLDFLNLLVRFIEIVGKSQKNTK